MHQRIKSFGLITTLLGLAGVSVADEFVPGGQFKDLILPMPILNKLTSEGIWGNEKVKPRDKDNGIEDNTWCYWGGNPIMGNDGNYHIPVCRWPENTGHNGWFEAEVAHCVSDNPIGPYTITKTIAKKAYNPEVMKLPDNTFALHVHDGRVFQAEHMTGPWKMMGRMKLDSRGFRKKTWLGSNLTTEYRPDGSILLMQKVGDMAISKNGILGPYKTVSIHNYTRSTGYPEDPVIWRSRHQYHAIYNHAQDRRSAYMRSLDGIHWKNEDGLPYDASTTFYTDGTKNTWYKFERPKVLQDEHGRATHLSLAVMDVAKRDEKANDIHSSKNMIMPLVTEKLISIVGTGPITKATRKITVRIEAEEGFDPQKDLDLSSLRFGSDSVVNVGEGCKAVRSKAEGKDLLVTFEGKTGLNNGDFDLKLIGRSKKDDLIFGYAALPGKSPKNAALITLPIKLQTENGTTTLSSALENWGLTPSTPTEIELIRQTKERTEQLASLTMPGLKPYESKAISIEIENSTEPCEYELRIKGKNRRIDYMTKIDDSHASITFTGDWQEIQHPDCFLGGQKESASIGDAVELTFDGVKVAVYGTIERNRGSYDVFIDGQFIEKIRSNWGGPVHRSILYRSPLLTPGKHSLKLVKSKSEHMGPVTIDAFGIQSNDSL